MCNQHVKHKLQAGGGHCERKDVKAWREPAKLPLHRRLCEDKFKGRTQGLQFIFNSISPWMAQNHVRRCTRVTDMVSPADGWQNYWQQILLRLCVAAPARTAFENYSVLLEKIWKISISYISVFKWKECFYCCCFCRYYLIKRTTKFVCKDRGLLYYMKTPLILVQGFKLANRCGFYSCGHFS